MLAMDLAHTQNGRADSIAKILDDKKPAFTYQQVFLNATVTYPGKKNWWEDAKSKGDSEDDRYEKWWKQQGESDLDDVLSGLVVDIPDVTRRPDGTIDHAFCDHMNNRKANKRCNRKNKH